MRAEERVACELERAVSTLQEWQHHPNVNVLTPQEIINLIASVLSEVAKDLQGL